MALPFLSFSACFSHSCRNSCCLLLHFLITSPQSFLLLSCLHYCMCFFYSHTLLLISQVLQHSHNPVHSFFPSSTAENSSKLCSLPFSFFEPRVLPMASSCWSFCAWVCSPQ